MTSNQLAEKKKVLSGSQQTRYPLKDILYRLRDPELVADTMMRAVAEGWHLISPSEFSKLYRQVRGRTICSVARLRGLHDGVKYVVENHLPGDLVECGCARGGSAALMALSLRQLGDGRNLWLFDTFEGLPAPTPDDPDYEIADLFTGSCLGPVDEVSEFFQEQGVAHGVEFVKGLFQDTIPRSPIEQIALLHIDGDWYESVKVCLDGLYDRVVAGGIIQFDDYGYWKGARKAVDEFMAKREIKVPLERLDYSGRTLRKPFS
jgi:Macrocin-O-methyltransferase (TylF)